MNPKSQSQIPDFQNQIPIPIPDPRFSKANPNPNPKSQIFKMNPKSQSQSRKSRESPGSRGFWDLLPTPGWEATHKRRLNLQGVASLAWVNFNYSLTYKNPVPNQKPSLCREWFLCMTHPIKLHRLKNSGKFGPEVYLWFLVFFSFKCYYERQIFRLNGQLNSHSL